MYIQFFVFLVYEQYEGKWVDEIDHIRTHIWTDDFLINFLPHKL